MKQKLFTQAIVWIAENDEPTVKEAAGMVNLISVALVADVFGEKPEFVAEAVVRVRKLMKEPA